MSQQPSFQKACAEFADRLVDLSDGELLPDERDAVESHVANCDACREQRQRLDASLAAFRDGIVPIATVDGQRSHRFARDAVWIAVGSTAAATLVGIGIASYFNAPTSGRGESAVVKAPAGGRCELPHSAAMTVSTEDALRRIALLEQQARLETSLALMPDDPWFADQRETNEHLLATFREATAAQPPTSATNPRSEEAL
jgi:anti-sigma factor RsiW